MIRTSKVLVEPSTSIERDLPYNLLDADLELFQDFNSYRTNDISLKTLENVWVSPESRVYKRGLLLGDTLANKDEKFYHQTRSLAKHLLSSRRAYLDPSKHYLLVTDEWSIGHYHWLTETLPRLWAIRDRLKEYVLLLPDAPYIRKTGLESLTMLGLKPADIVFMQPGSVLKVRRLQYVSRVAEAGQVHDRLMKEIRDAFTGGKAGGEGRIYLSRGRAQFRKILNEDDLIEKLKDYGFEIVYGESVTLEEQVELFSTCSVLIGLHGAGLTNCLFMPPGGTVIELRKREPNHAYWHLAEALGQRYFYYDGVPDSELSLIGRGCNLTIDIEDFETKILSRI